MSVTGKLWAFLAGSAKEMRTLGKGTGCEDLAATATPLPMPYSTL